ncbi:MAG TPA: hypothetical protein VJV04_16885 [Nitrospiraceae bacterium]|nr:hypothetical protein [Nitrospiraceae bacterium]
MNEQMMWVAGYLLLSSLPLMAAVVIVKQLIVGYGEPVRTGTAMSGDAIPKMKRNGG